ncbi:hypothetical protein EC178200_4279, partial [Escherichia coli 178200]
MFYLLIKRVPSHSLNSQKKIHHFHPAQYFAHSKYMHQI